MMARAEEQQKTLLIGNVRICQQIAYVLDLQNYELAKKLTKKNFDQYRDYQIYVCEFKRKSRGLVKLGKVRQNQLNLAYLENICYQIDEEYYANRQRHANDLNPVQVPTSKPTTKAVAAPTITTTLKTEVVKEQPKPATNKIPEPTEPLMTRIRRGMKHPFSAAWHLILRIKETIRRQRFAAKRRRKAAKRAAKKRRAEARRLAKRRRAMLKRQRIKERKHRQQFKKLKRNYRQVKKRDLSCLRHLKPSELLLYVLQAKPNKNIACTRLEDGMQIISDEVKGCCSATVAFGSLLRDGELDEIYHSTYARIVKLSSLNRSYCLCNLNRWCKGYCSQGKLLPQQPKEIARVPVSITLAYDHSCNLSCKSCRSEHYQLDDDAKQQAATITTKLLRSGYLEQTKSVVLAGMGEVFYSPYYRQLLISDLPRQQIKIKSNGILFNAENWRLLAGKYKTINVEISVDAATAETYKKLRGADFAILMKNLTMISDLRHKNQVGWFGLCFVVQRDNFREMPAFVELGKMLGVDSINFQRLNNFGTFTPQELAHQCLIVDNNYLDYELWCVLQDPIFQDPIVELSGLQRYIDASERLYRRRYEREQKQNQSV